MRTEIAFDDVASVLRALAAGRRDDVVVPVASIRIDGEGAIDLGGDRAHLTAAARRALASRLDAPGDIVPTDGDELLAALVNARIARATGDARLRVVEDGGRLVIRALTSTEREPADEMLLLDVLAELRTVFDLRCVRCDMGAARTSVVARIGRPFDVMGQPVAHGLALTLDEPGDVSVFAAIVVPEGRAVLVRVAGFAADMRLQTSGLVAALARTHRLFDDVLGEHAHQEIARPSLVLETLLCSPSVPDSAIERVRAAIAQADRVTRLDIVEAALAQAETLEPDARLSLELRAGELFMSDI